MPHPTNDNRCDQIVCLGKIYAANARVEGMKAENQCAKIGGSSYLPFDQRYFEEQASIIEAAVKELQDATSNA